MRKLFILFILFSNGVLAGIIPQNEVLPIIESGRLGNINERKLRCTLLLSVVGVV